MQNIRMLQFDPLRYMVLLHDIKVREEYEYYYYYQYNLF